MSHYALTVLVDAATPEEALGLLPESMSAHEGEHWDWYMLGGRYKGYWSGQAPEADPANYSPCAYCGGTGTRPDMDTPHLLANSVYPIKDGARGCNVCGGTGMARSWPTKWKGGEGEIMRAADVPRDKVTFALLTPDGEWFESPEEGASFGWWRERMDAHPDCFALLVDCHV